MTGTISALCLLPGRHNPCDGWSVVTPPAAWAITHLNSKTRSMYDTVHLAQFAYILTLCTSVQAGFVTSSEDFSSRQQYNYSTWLSGCFGGIADIRTMDAYESLVVYSGFLDHNANGMISTSAALTNNWGNEQTFILFNQGPTWDRFVGEFSCVWNASTPGRVSFTFINTTTASSQTFASTLEGLNGSLRELDFQVTGGFNQVVIDGNGVIMDNLFVSVPAPAAAPLLALAGLTSRGWRRR